MAIASTVAATRLGTLLGQGRPANVALTGGFHWAFWVCGAIALLGVPAAAALRRRTTAPAGLDGAVPALQAEQTTSQVEEITR